MTRERVNLEVKSISNEEVRENIEEDEEWKGCRPGRHASGCLETSRKDCTGVPYETVQQNDGK